MAEWHKEGDAQIVQAHQTGDSLRQTGRITGLSHPAVKKIVEKHAAASVSITA